MKIKQSPLRIIDFVIIKSKLTFLPPKEGDDLAELFSSYDIDLDYAIVKDDSKTYYQIFVKIGINDSDKPNMGYKVFVEGIGVFALDAKEKMTEDEVNNYIGFTALMITINHLRDFISNLTSFAPLGKYLLPSIDMRDITEQKATKIKEEAVKAKSTPKAKSSP